MSTISTPLKLIGTGLLAMTLIACNDDDDDHPVMTDTGTSTSQSIVDVARSNGSFTTLIAALEATGLDQTLSDESATFTVFAPTDDAFALLGTDTINALLADTDTLSDILTYHVISGSVNAEAAVGSAGTAVTMVNNDAAGLSLSGSNLLVNTSTVTATDITASNGLIHVIDAVLLPSADKGEPTMDIVDTAIAAGTFTTLVTALQATGLDSTLADPNTTFTVFAPTDDAFAKLGTETITSLLADTAALSDILLQHVVSGAEVNSVTAYTLNGQKASTAGGKLVMISIDESSDALMVGGATVITKDIYTTNGVIHVIDTVITTGETP